MNRDQFSRLEERIEQLIEGSFARWFGNRLHPREVAVRLARAVEDNVKEARDGQLVAPNTYRVCLNPEDASALFELQPELAVHLGETVIDFANRAGLRLESTPFVDICQDENIPLRDIQISARHSRAATSTQVLEPAILPQTSEVRPRNPQFILNGTQYIPLDRSVINIGRKRENHIHIDDSRVSRKHAQVRLRFGRYVLYDLGSTGGTFVNNHRVTEVILHPGDVVSLAGVTLVYIEDDAQSRSDHIGDTQMRALRKDDRDP